MNIQKLPALALAIGLQVFPICRVACVNQAAAPTGFAIVMQWLAGAVALLGGYHAVSGASAAISGVAPINSIGIQTGLVTTNATGTNGQLFRYLIVVSNPGQNPQQAFYQAAPLPPGLTINTNLGGNGWITGTPTTVGVYSPVLLTAGNANFSNVVTLPITITISGGGGGSPPVITGPPTNQTVQVGANVSFTVGATGSTPLSYLWKFGGTAISGATTASLQLTNVQTTNSGTYSVTVTNSAGSMSASATLSVTVPTASALTLANLLGTGGSWSFDVTGPAQTNYVIWSSTNLARWAALKTNFSTSGAVHFTDSNAPAAMKFYRATLSP